jgi:hypothetical protein
MNLSVNFFDESSKLSAFHAATHPRAELKQQERGAGPGIERHNGFCLVDGREK